MDDDRQQGHLDGARGHRTALTLGDTGTVPPGPAGRGDDRGMAVTNTGRLGLTRWSSPSDPFRRAQLDADHQRIEQLAAIYVTGTAAGRPAAGVSGRFYYATDTGALSYDNGTSWSAEVVLGGDQRIAVSKAAAKFSKADTAPVRVMLTGTSIAFGNSLIRQATSQAGRQFGWTQTYRQQLGVLGGSYDGPVNNWSKDVFVGQLLRRLKSTGSSTPLNFYGYCDQVVVEYSKEVGGATSVDVTVDGTVVGTINCSAADAASRALGQIAVFNVALGQHTLTFNPPASGVAYLEAFEMRRTDRAGVEVIDITLGGSSLGDFAKVPGTGISNMPVYSALGVDAVYGRTDVDVIFCTHTVNDAGAQPFGGNSAHLNTIYKPALDRLVQKTRDNNVALVLVTEPAGHFAMSGDPNRAGFNQIKEWHRQVASANSHVTYLDWDGLTRLADMNAYVARYYDGVVISNEATGAYTGDFIHIKGDAHRVGAAALCNKLGLQAPVGNDVDAEYGAGIKLKAPQAALPPAPLDVATRSRRIVKDTPAGYAVDPLVNSNGVGVPFYVDPLLTNYVDQRTNPANPSGYGTQGADRFGPYRQINNTLIDAVASGALRDGETFTVLMLVSGNVSISKNEQFYAYSLLSVTDQNVGQGTIAANYSFTRPTWIAYRLVSPTRGQTPTIQFTGRLYAMSVVAGTNLIYSPTAGLRGLSSPGPDIRIAGDPDFNPDYLHQPFFELLSDLSMGAGEINKTLVGSCLKWSTTATNWPRKGVYRANDRTAADYRRARVSGTKTQASTTNLAGGGENTDDYSEEYNFGVVALTASNPATYTLAHRNTIGGGHRGVRIKLVGGSTVRWLQNDGSWTATENYVGGYFPYSSAGETFAFTFALSTDTAALGTAPTLIAVPGGGAGAGQLQGHAAMTLAKGSSALI